MIITVLAEGHLRETFCVNVITENGTAFGKTSSILQSVLMCIS